MKLFLTFDSHLNTYVMKTIQFTTQDKTQWIININQITCLTPNNNGSGTFVYLSCGTKLHTILSTSALLEMINREVNLED